MLIHCIQPVRQTQADLKKEKQRLYHWLLMRFQYTPQ